MTAKIQRHCRAAVIRALLLDRPAGATAEQLLATGIDCSLKQLNNSLGAMFDANQLRATVTAGNKVWFLTTAMRKLMRGVEYQVGTPAAASARLERSKPTGSNNSTAVLHKDRERHELATLLADFRKGGGKIEVIGDTPVRPELSRRQINDAGAAARNIRSHSEAVVSADAPGRSQPGSVANATPPRNLLTQLPREAG